MSYEKVFCIGLNKTGTTTLGAMLSEMGLRHHAWDPSLFWLYQEKKISQLIDRVKAYDSFSDWPWPLMVPELLDHFGARAKFILTRRSAPQVWFESLKNHALITQPGNNARRLVYGYEYPHENQNSHIEFYQQHISETRQNFAQRGLDDLLLELCWEDGDDWERLSDFLNVPAPHMPMPHHNSRLERQPFLPFRNINLANISRLKTAG